MTKVPVVDYLCLEGEPHLQGRRCAGCGAVFLERHNGCARCGERTFETVDLPGAGELLTFTIVHRGSRGDPFVSVVVRLDDGTMVKGNLVDVPPRPERSPLE